MNEEAKKRVKVLRRFWSLDLKMYVGEGEKELPEVVADKAIALGLAVAVGNPKPKEKAKP